MRRSRSNRRNLFFVILLITYILFYWYIFKATNANKRDQAEEQAYLHAVRESLPMIYNPKLCSSDKIDLLFLIFSSDSHILERHSIRETWASMSNVFNVHSQHLFVLGYQHGSNLYEYISNEAKREQDILYLTVDDYGQTTKELHAYRWLEKFCPNVTFTFKTEDNNVVNSILLHKIIGELKTNTSQSENRYLYRSSLSSLFLAQLNSDSHKFLFGWPVVNKPERDSRNILYYVSYDEYPREFYPRYCSSVGYLMNSATRKLITAEGFKEKKPFRIADVYLTGILPERLNFTCDLLPFTYYPGTVEECISMIARYTIILCTIRPHVNQNTFLDYYRIWRTLKDVYGDTIDAKQNKS
ncbi:unnamed protein product [Adineta steineri]|uniref:Hexosyltransferase n=1 Tax=Adineta steineri TaxID=433720 RepID=A0A814K8U9_9BILA|nr:unnamed protein product [Adineta steineri]